MMRWDNPWPGPGEESRKEKKETTKQTKKNPKPLFEAEQRGRAGTDAQEIPPGHGAEL